MAKAEKHIALLSSEITRIEIATGEALGKAGAEIIGWFAKQLSIMSGYLDKMTGGGMTGGKHPGKDKDDVFAGIDIIGGPKASGALFNTTGTTSMIVGEAGTETVAVLRNPRTLTTDMGGSGGGVTINVNVTGGGENDDLARKIAVKVEETINRKASLLGLRRPV